MPYIGNVPAESYSQVSYQDLTGGSGTSFTLDYPAGSAGEIEVFVNNVRQEPTVAYTVSGTSLTMTGSIAATDDFYVVFQGKAQQTIGIPEKQTDGTYLFGDSVTIDADGSTVLTVDRATSDGTIIDVQKSGTTVGTIGVAPDSSYNTLKISSAYPSTGHIKFDNVIEIFDTNWSSQKQLRPQSNGDVNLGAASNQFKELFLSGGVVFGDAGGSGTPSSNTFDSYEEGTWTPVLRGTGSVSGQTYSSQIGSYTKVGNFAICSFYVVLTNKGSVSGDMIVAGLPFTFGSGNGQGGGTVGYINNLGVTAYNVGINAAAGQSYAYLQYWTGTSSPVVNSTSLITNSTRVDGVVIMRTS